MNVKTVERWVKGGIVPFARNRHQLSIRLSRDESYLWPDAVPPNRAADLAASELLKVYAHRSDVPRDEWLRLFESATKEIGVLVYAGLFFSEDPGLERILRKKAKAGVRIRMALGDPEDEHIADRGEAEGIGDGLAFKIRNALVNFRRLRATDGIEFRLHRTALHNSIYVADDQVLVNTHVYGLPAPLAPVLHLRKVPGGELTQTYLDSFERVWELGSPLIEEA
ncbi:XRE family transcriptional regulator [Kribbella sp. CA-293567]|uniref:XRE family transcriptional regulator n=1 Tax=Kribbella sp. CA-293567 TaxID=3002436 RepID=UPI0022DCFBA9|nr:XRE family transcriptional regulator [Kribbella sp. CA-293567]WBQ04342.1 XRE family transcriptional regulator [Kribbella sp. CA-293567]